MIESYLQPEGVDVQSVHVGQVTIPPRFEEAITTKVVTQQNAATVLMQRNVTIIESRTDIITKRAEADARVIVGEAEAEADVTMQRATAKGVAIVRQAEAKGLNDIGEELGMTVEEILELKLNRGIREMGGVDDIVVGWDDEFLSVKERT
jgi:regulator of protease activity HflC (stomatin/prohibitin superfamily)